MDELLVATGGAIKAIDGQPGRIGGYLVAWGSPGEKDLQGEYFTPDTEFELSDVPDMPLTLPALFHHGLDPSLKARRIGVIDTFRKDDVGLWVEAILDTHNEYVQAIQTLVQKGVLAWSSGSMPHQVKTAPDGHIEYWPIYEGSATHTPADWRGATRLTSMKSLPVLPLGDELAKEAEPGEPDKSSQAVGDVSNELPVTPQEVKMNLQEMLMQLLAAIVSAKPEWQMSEDEMAALVQTVMAQVQPEATPETAVEDSAIAAIAQKASPLMLNAVLAHFGELEKIATQRSGIINDAVKAALAKVPPVSKIDRQGAGAYTGAGQQHSRQPQPDSARITEVRTKYADMSAVDMSYLAMLDRFNRTQAKSTELLPLIAPENYPYFVREMADKAGKSIEKRELTVDQRALKAINFLKANELDHSTQATFGDEWVPTMWSDDLWRKARLDNVILPLFRSFEMPSNPFELPVEGADPTVYFVPETTDEAQLTLASSANPIPDSKIGSGKVTLTAKKLGLRVGFSVELTEDSIIPVLSLYREQAERAISDSIDHVLLNGDDTNAATGNINSDDADPADTEKYLAFNGLLHSALREDTTRRLDAGGVAPTLALIRQTRFKMLTAYAQRPKDIVYLVGGEVFAKLLNLDEFLTMDKIGNQATILNGMIGSIDGSPVLTSAEFGLAEADGAKSATPSNNTLGRLATVYRPNWYIGYKRRIAVSLDYLPYYDSYQLTATVRLGFTHFDDDSVGVLYNLAV